MRSWLLGLAAAFVLAGAAAAETPARAIAVTIDDLPLAHAGAGCSADADRVFTAEFLSMLAAEEIAATGFAIPGRGCGGEAPDPSLFEAWLEAGFEIGSHSNTHPDINAVGLDAYKADVIAAEAVLKPLLARRDKSLVWYRHPYLRTGATPEIRDALAAFLAERGYRIAPVTFDNSEWVFAAAYAAALKKGDAGEARRIGEAYVEHMTEVADFYESRSMAILGREPPQVLLIHANYLNRDWFPAVADMLRGRGYAFVGLDEATSDPAYRLPDTHAGRYGMSWILRWGLLDGVRVVREPDPPDWVTGLYRSAASPP